MREVVDFKRWVDSLLQVRSYGVRAPHCFKLSKTNDGEGDVILHARFMAWRHKTNLIKWPHSIKFIDNTKFQQALKGNT